MNGLCIRAKKKADERLKARDIAAHRNKKCTDTERMGISILSPRCWRKTCPPRWAGNSWLRDEALVDVDA